MNNKSNIISSVLSGLLPKYREDKEIRKSVKHNSRIFKRIQAGFQMTERYRIDFNPRREFWRPPERRVLISYFAKRWDKRYAPSQALRKYALRVFSHFDRARSDGIFTWMGVDYESMGGWQQICESLIEHAEKLPRIQEFDDLKKIWVQIDSKSASEHILSFLYEIKDLEDWYSKYEPAFAYRLPWFPYLGAKNEEDLARRQGFFFGLNKLFMSTNAFIRGGAMNFAPVLQNTETSIILDIVKEWHIGNYPDQTKFLTLGVDDLDDEPQDRSHYASVIETFGFLNLHNAPYYNNRTSDLFKKLFGKSEDTGNPYELMRDAGKTTRNYILENQSVIADLKDIFVELIELSPIESNVPMEGLRSSRAEKKANQLPDNRIDTRLMNEMENLAQGYMKSLDDKDAALCVLHLLIDAELYRQKVRKETETPIKPIAEKKPKDGVDDETVITGEKLHLPAGLIEPGERALAYLRVGLNVLFAGAPGTGKTTLAQFVAYSWNNQLDNLAEEMRLEAAPLTTVGNSAWSPFHTIGGLFPSPDGSFIPKPGIFIDPDRSVDDNWYLRPEAIVLDEMNRADLDRCIGELYPLLSRSVNVVYPAGIPGIKTIISDPNFRVVATINDATLDDIVFPISEGLSRRFQRIELPGASEEDVIAFLDLEQDTVSTDKGHSVKEIISQLFSFSGEKNLLKKHDETDRLPFGAGYFYLLHSWVHGKLYLSETFNEKKIIEQAFDILCSCLSTTIKIKSFDEIFELMRRQI